MINLENSIRKHFPLFRKKIKGKNVCYLDNAAITQVPYIVIDSLCNFYKNMNSNIHRSAYYLSELATEKYEGARMKIAKYIGADHDECIFVKGTTEGINLIAHSFLKNILEPGDEILISQMEHHSNIVPWYLLSKSLNIKLKYIPILETGDLDYSKLNKLINKKTKILAITHISNSLGTINDLNFLIKTAHLNNIPVLVDGAQSLSNLNINVKELDCDFFVFSSHKFFGPNGLGIVYAKKSYLKKMSPYQGGGDMISYVTFSDIGWNKIPYKFEAGTQSIANVIAFGDLIDFINSIDLNYYFEYKKKLFNYTLSELSSISDIKFIGNPKKRVETLSFLVGKIHPHDLGTVSSHYGVSIRTGHHCTMPVMDFYGISSTARISLSIYNTEEDIFNLIKSIKEAKKIFG